MDNFIASILAFCGTYCGIGIVVLLLCHFDKFKKKPKPESTR